MEEAGIWGKNFNNIVNNKSNEIRKEIEEENVLSIETKQENNRDVTVWQGNMNIGKLDLNIGNHIWNWQP